MNNIHPTSIVGPSVRLGNNNYIGPYCYITGNTEIGDNNRFEAYCSIGTAAEHKEYFNSNDGKVVIGSNNTFREFITINAGTKYPTIVGSFVTMLRNSHVGHDAVVEDKVNLACNVLIGGHSHIMEGANFGLGSMCHQFSVIGAYVMIGMGSVVTKKSKMVPGGVYVGSPVNRIKDNTIGLQRNGINQVELDKLIARYQTINTYL